MNIIYTVKNAINFPFGNQKAPEARQDARLLGRGGIVIMSRLRPKTYHCYRSINSNPKNRAAINQPTLPFQIYLQCALIGLFRVVVFPNQYSCVRSLSGPLAY